MTSAGIPNAIYYNPEAESAQVCALQLLSQLTALSVLVIQRYGSWISLPIPDWGSK